MQEAGGLSAFFAYPGEPELVAECMQRSARTLSGRGITAVTWQDLVIEGRLVVSSILEAIDAADVVVADLTVLNNNVLFEVGYAIAKDKRLFLVLDGTVETAVRSVKGLGLLNGIGWFDHAGSSEQLAARFLATQSPSDTSPTTWSDLSASFRAAPEPRTLFFYPTSLRGDAPRDLERLLTKRRDLAVLRADEDERGFAPLGWYAELVYRATASLLYLLGPQRVRSEVHNGRGSLLAGLSVGLGRPTLMLAESSFAPPVDYQDLLFQFGSARAMQIKSNAWLDELPTTLRTRPERLQRQLGLAVRFGEYVAENEQDELGEYFVETAQFHEVLDSVAAVFVGRKGTGKTASMLQAAEQLATDRRNLVVVVKPGSYELESLVEVMRRLPQRDLLDFFVEGLWEYLLYCEIAVAAVRTANARPAGIAAGSHMDSLRAYLEGNSIGLELDVGVRLDGVLAELVRDLPELPTELGHARHFLNERLHESFIHDLRTLLGNALEDRQRVALLIDNLDKAWDRGADYERISRVIFGLLTATGKLSRSFSRHTATAPAVNVTLAVFLRADIFSNVLRYAREPDKIKVLQIRWDNPELLARVIEDRYAVNADEAAAGPEVWERLFAPAVSGLPTRQYILWRCLSRPRDIVYFANLAVMSAVNGRRSIISDDDVREAEIAYSHFAFEALLVESDPDAGMSDLLFEFAGCQATLTSDDVRRLVAGGAAGPEEVQAKLLRASFLGLETSDGRFEYATDETSERKALVLARRLEESRGAPARFRIHPAFRPYLEVVDDDLEELRAVSVGQEVLSADDTLAEGPGLNR